MRLVIDAVYGATDEKSGTDRKCGANFWHMAATFQPSEVPMSTLIQTSLRRGILRAKALRRFSQPAIPFILLLVFPAVALAQSGSPFDTGFTALQNLFTGTVAKVASLIAIVIGGYQFAHGEPGSKKALAGVAAGTGIAVLAVNVLSWLWGI